MKGTSSHLTAKQTAIAIVIVTSSLLGCTGMSRSSESGYRHRENEPNVSRERRASERKTTLSEMGISPSRELSDREEEFVSQRTALKKAERNLEGKREREQYFKNKPFMKNDRDRLEFLALDSYETRQRWLNAKGVLASTTKHPPEVQSLVENNDIAVGFTKQAVKDSWGEPELVEVSGNPIYGNERWHYSEQTQSADGFHSQHRMVYFESGRVVGWESR